MNWLKNNVVGVITIIALAISGFTANSVAIATLESRLDTLETALKDKVITLVKLEELSTSVAVMANTQETDRKNININKTLIDHTSNRVYLAEKSTAVTNSILEKLTISIDRFSKDARALTTVTTLLDSRVKNLEYYIKHKREENEN